jgi:N6-adenosine-specific RNA methylase IME4
MNKHARELTTVSPKQLTPEFLLQRVRNEIGACLTVESCVEIAARAMALEVLARKQRDGEALALSFRLRVCALRKAGQLLKGVKTSAGGDQKAKVTSPLLLVGRNKTAKMAGLSVVDRRSAIRLANIPNLEFERLIKTNPLPTLQELENLGKLTIAHKERKAKLMKQARGNTALGLQHRYPVIYADPPWQYEHAPLGAGNRAIENHYPTMPLEEICRIPVSELATDDAVLLIWTTVAKLEKCFQVINAWGFTYRTNMVWTKDKIGMGYYVRNQHEQLLIAKRGNLPVPEPSTRRSSVVYAPRGRHSEKPKEFYSIIERMYPGLPKYELFLRGSPWKGWAGGWGNEATQEAAA